MIYRVVLSHRRKRGSMFFWTKMFINQRVLLSTFLLSLNCLNYFFNPVLKFRSFLTRKSCKFYVALSFILCLYNTLEFKMYFLFIFFSLGGGSSFEKYSFLGLHDPFWNPTGGENILARSASSETRTT